MGTKGGGRAELAAEQLARVVVPHLHVDARRRVAVEVRLDHVHGLAARRHGHPAATEHGVLKRRGAAWQCETHWGATV